MFADSDGVLCFIQTLLDDDGSLICFDRFFFADDVTIFTLPNIMFEDDGSFGVTLVMSDVDDVLLSVTDLCVRSGLLIRDVVMTKQYSLKRIGSWGGWLELNVIIGSMIV